ncbi:MAG: DUF721 domain-containing protein [Gammaproteobacteria bacterium]|nr:DUF721 domain-containing protein [Gammaproteobacteria bacterium]
MAAPAFNSLNALLSGPDARLRQLLSGSRQLIQLRDTVRRHLPSPLAPHCLGAYLEAGTLILFMDSAASATPIRYLQRELLGKFAAAGLACDSLKVQILPYPPVPPSANTPAPALTEKSRQLLESTATHLAEGPLKTSLLRLARNRNPRR